MRIRQLQLIRYGKFTDRTLDLPRAEQDIHLIVGPNEAGKSTVRSAITDWLFGIPVRTPLAFVHPMPDLRLGGTLQSEAAGELVFQRSKGNRQTLRASDDRALPDSALQPWLGSLDLAAFCRLYALDHGTLVDGGAGILSASDDLGRLLFQSAAGIEHLGAVLQGLKADADAQWGPRKAASRAYYLAQEQFEQASDALKKATLRTRDWKAQHDGCAEAAQALQAARERHAEQRLQLSQLERIRRVQPMLVTWKGLHTRLQTLLAEGDVPLLPENAAALLADASQAAALAEADIERLNNEQGQCRETLDALSVDDNLMALAPEITQLNEQRLQYRAHRQDIARRTDDLNKAWADVAERARGLGWPTQSEEAVRQRLPAPSVRTRLVRLLQERTALILDRRNAEAACQARAKELADAQDQLSTLSAQTSSPSLAQAIEQAQQLVEQGGSAAEWHKRLAQQSQIQDSAMAALGAWRREPADLQAMLVPPASTVQTLLAEQQADALENQSVQAAMDARTAEQRRVALALEQLVRSFQPVSREEVEAARAQRDAAWSGIKAAPLELQARASGFEQHLEQADTLADVRLQRMQHDADRQAQQQRLELLTLEIAEQAQRQMRLRDRAQQREQRWAALCEAAGLPGLPLEMAERWLDTRARVLQASAEHAALQDQLHAHEAKQGSVRQALWAQLGVPGGEPAPSLVECLRLARTLEAAAAQAQGQRSQMLQQAQAAEKSLVQLQASLAAANQAWSSWEAAWADASRSAGYADGVFPDQVDAELQVITDMDERLARIHSLRTERIEAMQADLQAFATAVISLCARAAPGLQTQLPEEAVLELDRCLSQARQAAEARSRTQAHLARVEQQLSEARRQLGSAHARLAPLRQTAGVHDMPALAQAIERSDQRRALERDIDRTLDALQQAGDGLTLEALQLEADSMDPAALRLALDHLQPQNEETVEQIAALSARHVTLQSSFDALSGTDAAAQAEALRQDALVRMADAVESHLRLHTAARLLKWSMEQYRQTRQGPMLARASATFALLTGGSFSRLVVDTDGATPRLYGVRPDGKTVEVSGMSEGSRDQLYLALRLAALELQIDQGRQVPLIADDLFINFDDQRTAAGLRVLGELSRRMQVVFLTHHDHLVPLAREVLGEGLNVVAL